MTFLLQGVGHCEPKALGVATWTLSTRSCFARSFGAGPQMELSHGCLLCFTKRWPKICSFLLVTMEKDVFVDNTNQNLNVSFDFGYLDLVENNICVTDLSIYLTTF